MDQLGLEEPGTLEEAFEIVGSVCKKPYGN